LFSPGLSINFVSYIVTTSGAVPT